MERNTISGDGFKGWAKDGSSDNGARKQYVAPKLAYLGSVRELTLGSGAPITDGVAGGRHG